MYHSQLAMCNSLAICVGSYRYSKNIVNSIAHFYIICSYIALAQISVELHYLVILLISIIVFFTSYKSLCSNLCDRICKYLSVTHKYINT